MLFSGDMGFAEKHPADGVWQQEGSRWVIATRPCVRATSTSRRSEEADEEEEEATTPTARGALIPEKLPCPPAPRKRKPALRCQLGGVKEFFTPPELETVFVRRPGNRQAA